MALDDLYPIKAFAAKHSDKLTEPTIRWQLRHRHANGLASAVVRIGKQDLISQSRYEAWLATRAGAGAQ